MRTNHALLLSLASFACASTPPEMPTVQEFVKRSESAPQCERLIEFVDAGSVNRPYLEVSRISVTCHPSLPELCRRSLEETACSRHADAVLLVPPGSGASRNVPSVRDQVWQDAILARWN